VPESAIPAASPRAAAEDVAAIVTALGERDISVFATDITTPDLRRCGLWVVRALVPQLYPLVIEHGLVLDAHPRLAALGEVNPDPHPFP
jgi:hypothetical protein